MKEMELTLAALLVDCYTFSLNLKGYYRLSHLLLTGLGSPAAKTSC
jgi:hypothetical protein